MKHRHGRCIPELTTYIHPATQCVLLCFSLPSRFRRRPWCLRGVSCACKCNCTSPPLKKKKLAGNTDDDVGVETARRPRSTLSFDFGLARAQGQRACLQHHGRFLSTRRNSDGPSFYTRNECSGEFLFRASGRLPNVLGPFGRGFVPEELEHSRTDGLTVTRLPIHAFSCNSDVSISENSAVTQVHVS